MTQFNTKGFVVKRPDGRLLADSHLSAYSSRVARTNCVLEPVPDAPGLFARLGKLEVVQISDAEREHIHAQAREWLTAQPEDIRAAVANATPDEDAQEEISLEDLKERARELDIAGRSKMDKAALFEAVQEAETAVANATADEEPGK